MPRGFVSEIFIEKGLGYKSIPLEARIGEIEKGLNHVAGIARLLYVVGHKMRKFGKLFPIKLRIFRFYLQHKTYKRCLINNRCQICNVSHHTPLHVSEALARETSDALSITRITVEDGNKSI